ncbi:hypothetical protein BDR26DRAFT_843377, partial [Obelidium mucronatum]
MKKFDALEKLKEEVISSTTNSSNDETKIAIADVAQGTDTTTFESKSPAPCSSTGIRQESAADGLGERELEELFRRTSKATVRELTSHAYSQQKLFEELVGNDENDEDDGDAYEWENEGDSVSGESNNVYMDDEREAIPQTKRRRRQQTKDKQPQEAKQGHAETKTRSKQAVLQALQSGSSKPPLPCTRPDPDKPIHIRIPNALSRAWGRTIEPFIQPVPVVHETHASNEYKTIRISILDPKSVPLIKMACPNPLVIYMDPPLCPERDVDHNRNHTDGRITVKELAKLKIPSLIQSGFLFIWAEKEFTPDILKMADVWGFRYVENFVWVKWTKWHRIASEPGQYFRKSKTTCFIFRKEGEAIDLKHQRNPDCEFDFIKPIQ